MRSRGLLALAGLALVACARDDNKQVLPPVVLGMLETTPPAYDDGEQKIYQVAREVRLPYRRPEDNERPKGDFDPYPGVPFHVVGDSRLTVRFTLTNLEDKPHNVELLVDPWNEFVRYVPGVSPGREPGEVVPNFSGIEKPFVLPALGRVQGILTPDDMVELATDLTIAMSLAKRPPDAAGQFAGPALFNRTFNIQNRTSEPDAVLQPWEPGARANLAAVTGFDLGLRTEEAAKIAIELVIDLEDLSGDDRVLMDGDTDNPKLQGRPGGMLTPPAAPARQ